MQKCYSPCTPAGGPASPEEQGKTPPLSGPLALRAGLARALPIVLGYVPVAFAFGVLAVKNDFSPALAIAMSVFLFAGSGQFVAASLWGMGVGVASVVLTVFVVNLRHLLMSASLAAHVQKTTRWQRFLLGYELTDETFGVHSTAFQRGWTMSLTTLYACNVTAHVSWVLGTVVGVFMGSLITDVKPLGLDYALTAMFLALLVPQCRSRLHVVTALVAGTSSVGMKLAGAGQWNVIIATLVAATLATILSSGTSGKKVCDFFAGGSLRRKRGFGLFRRLWRRTALSGRASIAYVISGRNTSRQHKGAL